MISVSAPPLYKLEARMAQAGHGQDWDQFLVAPNNNPGVPWQPEVEDAPRADDASSRRPVFRRRSPTPLNLLCQIQVKTTQHFLIFANF